MSKNKRRTPETYCDRCDAGSAFSCRCPECPDCEREPCTCADHDHDRHPYGRDYDRRRVQRLVSELETGWQDMSPGRVVQIGNTIDTIVRKHVRSTVLRLPEQHALRKTDAIGNLVEAWNLLLVGRATWFDVQGLASDLTCYFDETDASCDAEMFVPD